MVDYKEVIEKLNEAIVVLKEAANDVGNRDILLNKAEASINEALKRLKKLR